MTAELFYREGIRSVGVDTLVQRAGVSKMTLYHHFASKDELAVAYLSRRDEAVHRFIEARVVELAPDPRRRSLAVFDAFAEQVERDGYRGCHLINTLVEFPEQDHPARDFALDRNAVPCRVRAMEIEECELWSSATWPWPSWRSSGGFMRWRRQRTDYSSAQRSR